MEITKTIPSHNPADENTLDGLNNVLIDKISMGIQNVIPAIVQSYDKVTNRAIVKPAITGVASQGQKISKEPYIDIPVLNLSGGGFVISFPIKQGDIGWLVACDRNISIFKQNLEESAPNDYRKHKFEDGFFIPDKINNTPTKDNSLIIQNSTGTVSIELTETGVNISGITDVTGNTTITGNTSVVGSLTVSTGATGSFTTKDNKSVTVTNGIVTSIS